MTLFRACRAETVRVDWLDDFTVIYHRSSGITHLLTTPAPEIIAALGEAGMTLPVLSARLAAEYDVGDVDDGLGGLSARLEELVAAGLVEAQPTYTS